MDKSSLAAVGAALADAGYRAVLVDLRGHGESTGRYLTYGAAESEDISALLDSLASNGTELGCTGVYGFSYGGAVALRLAARDARVQAVVAVAPFASLREVVRDYRRKYLPEALQLVPDAWFQSAVDEAGQIAGFDPETAAPVRAVARSTAKLLLIHGTGDTQVPLRHSLELARAAGSEARVLTVPGASHDAMPSDASGLIRRETVGWFDRWFEREGCAQGDAAVATKKR
jgi:dipeptidyl aminopeptidase/acylaminoacyl peptidase